MGSSGFTEYNLTVSMPKNSKKKTTTKKKETFSLKGEQLLSKVKELVREGNVRRITIKNKDGKTILMFPMTVGVVGAVLAPVLAAVGAMAALLTECSLTVEREK